MLLKFSAMFPRHLVPWPSIDTHGRFYGDHHRGTPPSGGLNARGVAKYSDFGPIESYISKMVQDRRQVSTNHSQEVVYELSIGTKISDLE